VNHFHDDCTNRIGVLYVTTCQFQSFVGRVVSLPFPKDVQNPIQIKRVNLLVPEFFFKLWHNLYIKCE